MAFFQTHQQTVKPDLAPQASVGEGEVSEESLRERRYLWTARAFAIVCAVSFVTNILMLMSLFSLVPLVRVQPYELTFSDKKSQTVMITPFRPQENVLNAISESMIRQYVTARHTITADPDEMAFRWSRNGLVGLLSTDNTFQSFMEESQKVLDAAVKAQVTRSVEIQSILPYATGASGKYWKVYFNLVNMSPQLASKEIVPYVAIAYVDYRPTEGSWENRMKNPIGFKVTQYGSETKDSFDKREQERLKEKGI